VVRDTTIVSRSSRYSGHDHRVPELRTWLSCMTDMTVSFTCPQNYCILWVTGVLWFCIVCSCFNVLFQAQSTIELLYRINHFSFFWATVYKTVHPMSSDRCLSCLSVTLVYCGQTIGWIRMPLAMQAGLSPGHIVIDGDPFPPPKKRAQPAPNFQPMPVVAKRLDGSRWHLLRTQASAQATLCKMGHSSPRPHFSAHFALARSPSSATAELLFHFSRDCGTPDAGIGCTSVVQCEGLW